MLVVNLVPRVLRLSGQWVGARRDSGELEFYYCRISAVKEWKLLRSLYRAAIKKISIFLNSPESLLATNRWPKSLRTLGTRLVCCSSDIVR